MADIEIPLRCSWLVGTRRAHGYLLVEEDLNLVALLDDSETAGTAGSAAAGQFGLIGALVGAGVGAAREGIRAGKLREAYATHQGMTTGQKLSQHPMSRAVKLAEVKGLKKGPHLAPSLETTGDAVSVQADGPGVHEAIEAWATRGAVPVTLVEPKKMSKTTKRILIFTLPALIGLYLLICFPFAVIHLMNESKAVKGFEEWKTRAVAAQALVAGPFGKSLAEACGEVFKQSKVEEQMALVGALPASTPKPEKDYYDFPRYTRIEPPYSKWDEGRIEDDMLESKWKREPSFGNSYSAMLSNPFNWIDRSSRIWGLPRMENVHTLLVGKVASVELTGVGGRATIAVRVLDYPAGTTKCEGDLELQFGGSSSGSVGNDFLLAQGLPRGMHLLSCAGSSKGPCKDVNYYASLAAPKAAVPEVAPVAAAPLPPVAKAPGKRTAAAPKKKAGKHR